MQGLLLHVRVCNHALLSTSAHASPPTFCDYVQDGLGKAGRLSLPWALFAYPFYLWKRSPGKEGSHYDPSCDLFSAAERNQVLTTNAYLLGMLAILAACTVKLGVPAMFCLYFVPYWIGVMWLDIVTYLHHHGSSDVAEKMPWYRGEVSNTQLFLPVWTMHCTPHWMR